MNGTALLPGEQVRYADDKVPYGKIDRVECKEAKKTGDNIVEVECSGVGDPLADFDGKGQDDENRHDVEPGEKKVVSSLGEPSDQGDQHKDHEHADDSDHDEVEFLIGETFCVVIQGVDFVVDSCNVFHDEIEHFFHGGDILSGFCPNQAKLVRDNSVTRGGVFSHRCGRFCTRGSRGRQQRRGAWRGWGWTAGSAVRSGRSRRRGRRWWVCV